jgi:ribulose 1,5-bisphosphate carboxylase large subunit-like protein
VKEPDILACFKNTPQAAVDREEAAAAVAAESSTGIEARSRWAAHVLAYRSGPDGRTAAPFLHRHRFGVST